MRGRRRKLIGAPVALLAALAYGASAGSAALAAAPPLLAWSPMTSPSTNDFGFVDSGAMVRRQFTLTNAGGTASANLAVALRGSAAFAIVSDGCSTTSVGPKKRCVVTVDYTAGAPGATATATLTAIGRKPDASA